MKSRMYIISDVSFFFEKIEIGMGQYFGYCAKLKKWAWLYNDSIQFENEKTQKVNFCLIEW